MALRDLAAQVEDVFGVPCRYEGDEVDIVNDVTAMHLYRIAQEAVSNAVRHADPDAVTIQLHPSEDAPRWAELVVIDDGIGISEETLDADGLGLRILRFRTAMIDGRLSIRRRDEGGTLVRCRFDPMVVPEHRGMTV
jgi:signal transduction histidine kinase